MGSHPLAAIPDQERFGLRVGQKVRITSAGLFFNQTGAIIEFTNTFVVVPISGPPGEPDGSWWFKPSEVEPIINGNEAQT